MLTLQMLKDMKPHSVIARGESVDSPLGINMTNSGRLLKWIAMRGEIEDWSIYCHWASHDYEYVMSSGDKIHNMDTVKRLIPCDEGALNNYRH